jgi:hypothetical protein
MSKRGLTWLRQHTNVEDLLDDGIDNNSDLKSFALAEQPSDEPPISEAVEVPLQKSHIESSSPEPMKQDFFVAAIGVLIMGCGLSLVLHPVDLIVHHLRAIEHVTSVRSEVYGWVGILFGAALLVYAFKKPRK